MSGNFSDRYNYNDTAIAEITIREDAPSEMRYAVVQIAESLGIKPTKLRELICKVLLEQPDSFNWSEYPNVWEEVQQLIANCTWHRVYDIAETIYESLEQSNIEKANKFSNRLNQYFREKGIGWEMHDGQIIFRGTENFASTTETAVESLEEAGLNSAANEIREAVQDISRRPKPDITGAVQHAFAALESTSREVTGNSKRTLGQNIRDLDLPNPLDSAIEKLWGYASNRGRHIQEGKDIQADEAELMVIIACATCTFLLKRNAKIDS